jgi:hypothetical protein
MLTVPVIQATPPGPPPGPPPPPPVAPPAATTPAVVTAVAPAPVIAQPAVAQPAVVQPVVAQPAVAQPAVAQPQMAVVTPAAVTSPPPVAASGTTAAASSSDTLNQLLGALARSQITGPTGSAPAPAASAQPTMVTSPRVEQATVAQPPARVLAVGFVMPAPPTLSPVPTVALPPSFCSAEARNTFHDSVYLPSVNIAKQNNDAAAAYMRQLQSTYDQYQLSHDPDTMNEIVGAARTYQQVAQTTFSMESALVRQFNALMAVPLVPCSQPGQPPATTLAK